MRLALVPSLLATFCEREGVTAGVPEPLSLCEVVAHAGEYSRQRVRVRGLLASGAEQNVIYDPNCTTSQDPTYVSEAPELKKNRKLNRLLRKERRAWVVSGGRVPRTGTSRDRSKAPAMDQRPPDADIDAIRSPRFVVYYDRSFESPQGRKRHARYAMGMNRPCQNEATFPESKEVITRQ